MQSYSSNTNKKLILNASKDKKISDFISNHFLESKDWKLIIANDGYEVINISREMLPGIILLDIKLPIMDGFAVTKLIREFADQHQTKIIFISDLNNYEIRDAAIAVGGNDYLLRPFNSSNLKSTLNKYVY